MTKAHKAALETDGYVVLPDVLSPEECDQFSRAIDDIWLDNGFGELYNWHPGVRFSPNLLEHSTIFERFVTHPLVLAAVEFVIGPEFVLSLVNGRRVDPGAGNQPLHDLTRRRGRPFVKCNAIWCLDEFTAVNGSTRVLPGSHLSDERFMARCVDPELPHPDERLVEAPRGSVIVHNSHLIHAGSQNRTDAPRRSAHSAFCVPGEPTRDDWRLLPPPIQRALTPLARSLMGLAGADKGRSDLVNGTEG